MAFSINSHAWEEGKGLRGQERERKHKKEGEEKKWSGGAAKLCPWIVSFVSPLVSLVLCATIG